MTISLQELEAQIQDYKKTVALGKALDRLEKNADFNLLISEGYFKNEAAASVLALGTLVGANDDTVIKTLYGISNFSRYLSKVRDDASTASNDLTNAEELLSSLTGL